ncbi:MAG: hypothetical protein PWP56_2665 [Acetobacterium sp.]|jgi:hypothetical protein|uniref:hypothetical protein n=1 Tax=unclassified Acetobacterium TaxID=2638182 RepID=UPI001955053D|nr:MULTISPECIES: hypothetical protein [unclassified Acetobacterium]MDK2943152.1 hypothetical protein [Acetobacterium sp.]MDZ5726790.1 hypothetical protein [Acetobacterium sp. K1/6]
MNNEFNSEYYDSFIEAMQKYEIPESAFPFTGETFQGIEEMFFGFTMFLIS